MTLILFLCGRFSNYLHFIAKEMDSHDAPSRSSKRECKWKKNHFAPRPSVSKVLILHQSSHWPWNIPIYSLELCREVQIGATC